MSSLWEIATFRTLKETSGFTAFICLIPDSSHIFPSSIIFLIYVPPRCVLDTCKILKSFAVTHICPPPFPKRYNFTILLTGLVLIKCLFAAIYSIQVPRLSFFIKVVKRYFFHRNKGVKLCNAFQFRCHSLWIYLQFFNNHEIFYLLFFKKKIGKSVK